MQQRLGVIGPDRPAQLKFADFGIGESQADTRMLVKERKRLREWGSVELKARRAPRQSFVDFGGRDRHHGHECQRAGKFDYDFIASVNPAEAMRARCGLGGGDFGGFFDNDPPFSHEDFHRLRAELHPERRAHCAHVDSAGLNHKRTLRILGHLKMRLAAHESDAADFCGECHDESGTVAQFDDRAVVEDFFAGNGRGEGRDDRHRTFVGDASRLPQRGAHGQEYAQCSGGGQSPPTALSQFRLHAGEHLINRIVGDRPFDGRRGRGAAGGMRIGWSRRARFHASNSRSIPRA